MARHMWKIRICWLLCMWTSHLRWQSSDIGLINSSMSEHPSLMTTTHGVPLRWLCRWYRPSRLSNLIERDSRDDRHVVRTRIQYYRQSFGHRSNNCHDNDHLTIFPRKVLAVPNFTVKILLLFCPKIVWLTNIAWRMVSILIPCTSRGVETWHVVHCRHT